MKRTSVTPPPGEGRGMRQGATRPALGREFQHGRAAGAPLYVRRSVSGLRGSTGIPYSARQLGPYAQDEPLPAEQLPCDISTRTD